jgi:hypothetical protein
LPESKKIQPDWNQNDENALDYIKNRTHYDYEKLALLREPLTLNCNGRYTLTFYNENNEAVKISSYYNEAYAYWLGWDYLKGQTILVNHSQRRALYAQFLRNAKKGKYKRIFADYINGVSKEDSQKKFAKLNG